MDAFSAVVGGCADEGVLSEPDGFLGAADFGHSLGGEEEGSLSDAYPSFYYGCVDEYELRVSAAQGRECGVGLHGHCGLGVPGRPQALLCHCEFEADMYVHSLQRS